MDTTPRSASRLRSTVRSGACVALLALAGCAGGSGQPACKVRVIKLEKWQLRPGALDAEYRVEGEAGVPGVVSLVAKRGPVM